MQIYNEEPYISAEDVADACGITTRAIRLAQERGSDKWQTAIIPNADQRISWVKYSCMKEAYQTMVCKKLFGGFDPVAWHKMQEMKGNLVSSWDYQETLEDRLLEACETTYQRLWKKVADKATAVDAPKREKQIKSLARAASMLDAMGVWLDEQGLKLSHRGTYDRVAAWVEANPRYFDLKYLPTSYRHLKDKIEIMAAEGLQGFQVVDVPRKGNNARCLYSHETKKEMRGIVVRMMAKGAGMHDEAIVRKVRFFYESLSEPVPSDSTVRRIMTEQQVKLMVADKRFADNKAGNQRFRSSTPLARAVFSGDCWEADGTRVQLQAFDKEGVRRTLFIVAIRDVSSGVYVGWSYGLAENSEMYFEALRMAVATQGHLPYELRVDGFRFNDEATRLFRRCENLGMKLTTTRVSTGKANAERGFGTLQGVFESEHRAWVGEGILSGDENSRPTTEYLLKQQKGLRAEGWDWAKAWQEHNGVMMAYNCTAYSRYSKKFKHEKRSPLQVYVECPKPHVINVEVWDRASLFWAETEREIKNFKLVFERRDKGKITFEMADPKYFEIHQKYKSVIVRYESETMEEVMLFDPKNDKYLCTVKAFVPIQLYGPEAEFSRNTEYRENIKAMRSKVKELKETTLDGSERVVDEMALSLGAMVSKGVKEMAETEAMEAYLFGHVPSSSSVLTTVKKEKGKKEVKEKVFETVDIYDDDVEIDAFEFAMSQM